MAAAGQPGFHRRRFLLTILHSRQLNEQPLLPSSLGKGIKNPRSKLELLQVALLDNFVPFAHLTSLFIMKSESWPMPNACHRRLLVLTHIVI